MDSSRARLEALVGRVLTPFERFLGSATAGGLVLLGATALALGLSAALGGDAVHHFWDEKVAIDLGGRLELAMSRHHWVNDLLMALFFLLVGLELKREMLVGELASPRDAALPIAAAIGGMVVPAGIYAAFNAGGPGASGWGIPMATDIAFAVGILVLLASRVPRNLVVFLTALAIADDLGAVLVIAIFYTAQIDTFALGMAGALVALAALLNGGGIRHPLPYVLVGILLWLYVLASGLHATLAGVLLAATVPARASAVPRQFSERLSELRDRWDGQLADAATSDDPLRNTTLAGLAEEVEHCAVAVQSPLQRMEHALAPWVAFVVVPIFALANAGIDLTAVQWSGALSQRVTLGVMLGLFVGKFAGISLACWIAVKLGLGRLPSGVTWGHVTGAAWLGGIGFTMSLFIGQLAFRDPALVEQAKLGILLASAASALVGLAWLYRAGASRA